MTKKLNAVAITPELLLFQVGTDAHRKARWSYRVTLPNVKPVERLISSHFAYSEIHWGRTNELFSTNQPPPDFIIKYSVRILHAYREQLGRTGKLILRQPTFLSLVDQYASDEEKQLIERHLDVPKDFSRRDLQNGHVMLVDLDKATYHHMKMWTEKFDDHEPKVRAILKKVLMTAYGEGVIDAIPGIL